VKVALPLAASRAAATAAVLAMLLRQLSEDPLRLQKTAAEKANVSYILDFRADMRGRLVQAALASKLAWGQAMLTGFAQAAANNLDEFDDQIPDNI